MEGAASQIHLISLGQAAGRTKFCRGPDFGHACHKKTTTHAFTFVDQVWKFGLAFVEISDFLNVKGNNHSPRQRVPVSPYLATKKKKDNNSHFYICRLRLEIQTVLHLNRRKRPLTPSESANFTIFGHQKRTGKREQLALLYSSIKSGNSDCPSSKSR